VSEFRLFGLAHVATLVTLALATIVLTVWVHREPKRIARLGPPLAVLLLSAGIGFVVVDAIAGTPWRLFAPLHICDIAVFIGAYALVTRHRLACELLYFWGCAGTIAALLTPDLGHDFPHYRFVLYFLQHGTIVLAAIVLVAGAGVHPRPRAAWIAWLWLNAYGVAIALFDWAFDANFLYLCFKPGTSTPFDWLGPWPWYVAVSDVLALVLFLLLQVPFVRRSMSA
jgi:hypothetical integral membrane protein (TIGR02206 family)